MIVFHPGLMLSGRPLSSGGVEPPLQTIDEERVAYEGSPFSSNCSRSSWPILLETKICFR